MTDRQSSIAKAALRVIRRYGVRRTTMEDVAQEAGISRQTLYAVFPGKDEVIRASIRQLCLQTRREVQAGAATARSFEDRLDAIFLALAVHPRRMLEETPEAADLMADLSRFAADEADQSRALYVDTIAAALAPDAARLEAAGLCPRELAAFLQSTLAGFKHAAADIDDLKAQLAVLKRLIVKASGG
ncbi:TetR/AcrR family transcriptional regulator [Oceaniglobus roseus]|uniref:TetR/AcrR family transcriptional regulator n=1 Tax=Oceaniglobus roseus TaxID=1737570 RepID=UPI001561F9F1|nr:TetR/AcrR family transcriptional regulator [Kandeliimicrobium roseum]